MLKDLKSKRRLSLFVALALSAGGLSNFQHAYAADVSGGNVYVDGTPAHPMPTVPVAGGAITNPSDNGNVYNNTLTIDGTANLGLGGTFVFGGYNAGTGNATGNTVIIKNVTADYGGGPYTGWDNYIYGGFSAHGNATGNTVILAGNNSSGVYSGMTRNSHLIGGEGTGDILTNNTLRVQGKVNETYVIRSFEKMQFDLDANLNSGDWMLYVRSTSTFGQQTFDWGNIRVTGVRAWATALAANNVYTPTLTLYNGTVMTLNNYAPALVGTRRDYEFGKRANTAGTGTVSASVLSVDSNRF